MDYMLQKSELSPHSIAIRGENCGENASDALSRRDLRKTYDDMPILPCAAAPSWSEALLVAVGFVPRVVRSIDSYVSYVTRLNYVNSHECMALGAERFLGELGAMCSLRLKLSILFDIVRDALDSLCGYDVKLLTDYYAKRIPLSTLATRTGLNTKRCAEILMGAQIGFAQRLIARGETSKSLTDLIGGTKFFERVMTLVRKSRRTSSAQSGRNPRSQQTYA